MEKTIVGPPGTISKALSEQLNLRPGTFYVIDLASKAGGYLVTGLKTKKAALAWINRHKTPKQNLDWGEVLRDKKSEEHEAWEKAVANWVPPLIESIFEGDEDPAFPPSAGQASGTGDRVNHPSHYTSHPSGIECIEIVEHFGFNIGNATKYLWRAGLKCPDPKEDLEKAIWYIKRELERLEKARTK